MLDYISKKKKEEDVNPQPDNKLIYVVVNRYCFGLFHFFSNSDFHH